MAERTVVTNFNVEKTGDTGAPGEIAADIQQVEAAAATAAPATEALAEGSEAAAGGLKDAGAAAAEASPKFEEAATKAKDAGASAKGSGDSFAEMARKVNFAINKVEQIHGSLVQAETKLNSLAKKAGLSGTEFEGLGNYTLFAERNLRSLGNIVTNLDTIFGVFNANSLEEFRAKLVDADNAIKGINPSLETAGKGLNSLAASSKAGVAALDAEAKAAFEAQQALEQFAESHGIALDPTKIQKEASAFAEGIASVKASAKSLTEEELMAAFGAEVQEMLDKVRAAGVEAPANLQAIASAWGLVGQQAVPAVDAVTTATDKLDTSLKSTEQQSQTTAGQITAAGKSFSITAAAISQATPAVATGAGKLKEAATAATETGKGLSEAATASATMAGAQPAVQTNIGTTTEKLDGVNTSLDAMPEKARLAVSGIVAAFAGIGDFSSPVIAQLDAIFSKAQTTLAEVNKVSETAD